MATILYNEEIEGSPGLEPRFLHSQLNAYSGLGLKPDFAVGSRQQLTQLISTDHLSEECHKTKPGGYLNKLFWNFTVVASCHTLMGCHRDEIYGELICSFSPRTKSRWLHADVSCNRFVAFWVAWEASGHIHHLFSSRDPWPEICIVVWYLGLCCWFDNGKFKREEQTKK